MVQDDPTKREGIVGESYVFFGKKPESVRYHILYNVSKWIADDNFGSKLHQTSGSSSCLIDFIITHIYYII